jgi:hypothetical protein
MVLCVAGHFNPPPHRNQCEDLALDARVGAPLGAHECCLGVVGALTVSCKVQPIAFLLLAYAQADG